VRVNQEGHIIVLFEDIEYVLVREGFTTGNGDEIDAHLFGFVEDPVYSLETQFLSLLVTTGIAAETLEVATHGWADNQESRWIVSSRLFCKGFTFIGSHQELVDDVALDDGPAVVRIESTKDFFGNFQGGVSLVKKVADPANPANVVVSLAKFLGKFRYGSIGELE
jgi:hypothetical protein